MAYNFSIQNGALRVFNDEDTSERYLFYASIDRGQNNLIIVKESGVTVTSFQFSDFGTIGGATPTDLNNAGDLLGALIESLRYSLISTTTLVTVTNVGQTLITSDVNRKKLIIENRQTQRLFIKFGSSATTLNYTCSIAGNEKLIETDFKGSVFAITGAGSTDVVITSLT
jgi:hypothetical protein